MPKYISILRGINVGGNKLIKMSQLSALCLELGWQHVSTYIQSGNLTFESKLTSTSKLSQMLGNEIKASFGFDVPVLTFELEAFERIVTANPFATDVSLNPDYFHITFLEKNGDESIWQSIQDLVILPEKAIMKENAIYLYCPNGYSKCKITNTLIEKKLQLSATTRNWKTCLALLHL